MHSLCENGNYVRKAYCAIKEIGSRLTWIITATQLKGFNPSSPPPPERPIKTQETQVNNDKLLYSLYSVRVPSGSLKRF